jgi:hypothetical protein
VLRYLIPCVLVAAAAGCGGTQQQAVRAPAADPQLPESAVAAMHLDRARARRVGAHDGRAIWIAPTDSGDTCLLDASPDAVGASCGRTLFGTHKLAFTESSEGGPPPRPVTQLRIVGVAAAGVRSVAVELSDGTASALTPNEAGAFVYEESPAQLADAVAPVALLARDGMARRVDRIDLPRAAFTPS